MPLPTETPVIGTKTLRLRALTQEDTDDNNLASLALLEKLGFQREGFFRERWYVNGVWQNSVMLGLLNSDKPPL